MAESKNPVAKLDMNGDEIKRRFAEAAERMTLSAMEKHWNKGEAIVVLVDEITAKASERSHERLRFRMVDCEANVSEVIEERLCPAVLAKELRAGMDKGHALFSILYMGLASGGKFGKYQDFRVEAMDDVEMSPEVNAASGSGFRVDGVKVHGAK